MTSFQNFFSNKKDKKDFFIAIVVLLLFGTGILYSTFFNEEASFFKNSPPQYTEANVSSENHLQDEITSNISPIVKEKNRRWVEKLRTQNIKNTSIITGGAASILASSTLSSDSLNHTITITEIEDSMKREEKQISESVVALENTSRDSMKLFLERNDSSAITLDNNNATDTIGNILYVQENKGEIISEEIESEEENIFEDQPSTTTYEKPKQNSCAIFIGAFRQKIYADQLYKRLQKELSYTPFSTYEKGYQVVGIKTSCDKSSNKELLQEIKNKYSKDAWFGSDK